MHRETVFIGFGSNQGDRRDYCDRAVRLLSLLPHSQMTGMSSLYETAPVVDERTDPGTGWFVNGVARLETELPARALLTVCREIEQALGRDPEQRGGARTMDLDILFYGPQVVAEEDLVIPHPRLHGRRFVLVPLVELAPDWVHPELGKTLKTLLDEAPDGPPVQRLDAPSGSQYAGRPPCQAPPSTDH